jgi:hypothetical protein
MDYRRKCSEENHAIVFIESNMLFKERSMRMKTAHVLAVIVVSQAFIVSPALAAEQKKPNILPIKNPSSKPSRRPY